ncbi:hypothetical protein Bbelb_379860 [Branchiostoma belcheri]|nr:hypothetical protein Bbelb_379860 [Branchiostoma belcheri]
METASRVIAIAATFVLFAHIVGASADFTHHASLDEDGKFLLFWKFDEEKIELEARVQTTGWVGLGLSPNGGMPGSDIAIGWVKDGTAHLTDRYAEAQAQPSVDESQDWELVSGNENGTHTVLRFNRKLTTCDVKDRVINVSIHQFPIPRMQRKNAGDHSDAFQSYANEGYPRVFAVHSGDGKLVKKRKVKVMALSKTGVKHGSGVVGEANLRSCADTMRVLWAWHDDDPEDESGPAYHGANRGVRSTVLLSNNIAPDNFKETNYTTVDLLMNNVSVPAYQDTTYWCQVFELPELAGKHHIIKVPITLPCRRLGNLGRLFADRDNSSIRQRPDEGVVHHLIIYTCTRNRSVTFLPQEHPGHECRTPNMPATGTYAWEAACWRPGASGLRMIENLSFRDKERGKKNERENCADSSPMTYPAHVGYPVGHADGSRYVLLEQHYDNPQLVSGIRDSSGLRLTLTPELRDYDLGVFEVGMPPIKHHVIPPHAEEFKSAGFCNPNCLNARTEMLLQFLRMLLGGPNSRHVVPPRAEGFKSAGFCNTNSLNAFLEELGEPIHIIGLELHSHLLAVKMSARLIHNGKEIDIARDDNYDFNLQFFRMLKEEVTVYPGDTLVTECTYRSTHKDKVTKYSDGFTTFYDMAGKE